MKRLFLLLLFINLVYFFWGTTAKQNKAQVQQQAPLYDVNEVETLRLISTEQVALEVAKVRAQQAVLDKIKEPVKPPINSCYVLGDFTTQAEAEQFKSGLGIEINQSTVIPIRTVDEYWVMYPAAATWEESLQNEAMIKNKGESDLWLVPKGGSKGVISLGLFVDIDRASNRLKELANKLIDAKIVVRTKSRFALKIEVSDEAGLVESFSKQPEPVKESGMSKISC